MRMDWSGLNFFVAATFITILTVGLGGVLLVIAWIKVLIESTSEPNRRSFAALRTYTVAILLDAVALPVLSLTSDDRKSAVWTLFLIASFVFVIASVVLGRRKSRPGGGPVMIGSMALFVVNVLGFLGIILSLPRMPLQLR
jgi:hypothetical protein